MEAFNAVRILSEGCAEEEQETRALQALINSGAAWHLEGAVGRSAIAAIEQGRCCLGKQGHRDFYGNYVPSRDEIIPGATGSVKYCRDRGHEVLEVEECQSKKIA